MSDIRYDTIVEGDARKVLTALPKASVDLSVWSPPYFVGKSYEQGMTFDEWKALLREVVRLHRPIIRPGCTLACRRKGPPARHFAPFPRP